MSELFRYEAERVDTEARDLPGLKAKFLLAHVPDAGVVLDVGCGGGKMLRTIAAKRPDVALLGCDLKEPDESSPTFEFRRVPGPDADLPYEDRTVDIALLFDVLEHVDDPQHLLDEIARVLRPGGLLIAFVPVEGEPLSWYALFRRLLGQHLYAETKDHIQAFRHREVTGLVGERFAVLNRRYCYHTLGQLMDAAFFACLRMPAMQRLFWSESPYHNREPGRRSLVSRVFASTLVAANAMAWAESTALAKVRRSSAGILLVANVRPDRGGRGCDVPLM